MTLRLLGALTTQNFAISDTTGAGFQVRAHATEVFNDVGRAGRAPSGGNWLSLRESSVGIALGGGRRGRLGNTTALRDGPGSARDTKFRDKSRHWLRIAGARAGQGIKVFCEMGRAGRAPPGAWVGGSGVAGGPVGPSIASAAAATPGPAWECHCPQGAAPGALATQNFAISATIGSGFSVRAQVITVFGTSG